MHKLGLYHNLSRWPWLNYRAKIMITAFIGTHIPLIALISFYGTRTSADWWAALATIGVALTATLAGTGVTLLVLNSLLRPVLMTSRSLRAFRESRSLEPLPTNYTDEVGTLMADAARTLQDLQSTLDELMFVDPVTGLANRDRFLQKVSDRLRREDRFAVCGLRIANGGTLATTFDTAATDQIARIVADRLGHRLDRSHHLSRVAPDTFAFVVDASGPEEDWAGLVALGGELCTAGAIAIPLDGIDVELAIQAGIALWPEDGPTADLLLDQAITAASVGVAQDPASGQVAFHTPALRQAARDRLRLEQDLRRALGEDQFVLHYQPVVDLSAKRVVGAEALIRWQHPERGLIPPGQFVPAAERCGLIDPIGLWVMREACRQARDWDRQGLGPLSVAVNLSARQFLDPGLLAVVRESLDHAGVSADQLEIELTETAAMVDHEHTRRTFTALRDLGVSIAIDDFGTGYAAMSYLRKLPFNKLKIDREFVANVHAARDSQAICAALVELSRGLGLRVLAEGTETEDEVQHLQRSGCQLFQGFYFSRPVGRDAFAEAVQDLGLFLAAKPPQRGDQHIRRAAVG